MGGSRTLWPRLTWIGHATVLIETDGVRLLTDPVLRDRVGPLRRHASPIQAHWHQEVDAVLISHLHHDHLDLPSLRLLGTETPVIVPRGGQPLLRRRGFRHVIELAAGEATRVGSLTVRATPADHPGFRVPYGPFAGALGYVVTGSARIYFAGDTDLFPEMAALDSGLDVALLPVGGWGPTLGSGHLDPPRAAQALTLLRPRVAVPIHWGTLWPIGLRRVRRARFEAPAQRFAGHAATVAPLVKVRVGSPGHSLHVPD